MINRSQHFTRGRSLTKTRMNEVLEEVRLSDQLDRIPLRRRVNTLPYCVITDLGPLDEMGRELPGFCDCRYWCKQIKLSATPQMEPEGKSPCASGTTEPPRAPAPPMAALDPPPSMSGRRPRPMMPQDPPNSGSGRPDPNTFDLDASLVDPETMPPFWQPCINIREATLNTHALPADTIVRPFTLQSAEGENELVFDIGQGFSIEAVISLVVTDVEDTKEADEQVFEWFEEFGKFLVCLPIKADNTPNMDSQMPVFLLGHLDYELFKAPDGSQIYDAMSPDAPRWTVSFMSQGLTLDFAAGTRLGSPPGNPCR